LADRAEFTSGKFVMVLVIQRSDVPCERIVGFTLESSVFFEDGLANSGISQLLYPVARSRFESSTYRV